MRHRLIITIILLHIILRVDAQNYSVAIENNDPNLAYSQFLAPLFGYEISDNFNFYLGTKGRYAFSKKFDVEGIAGLDIFQIKGKGPGLLFEGGIFLPFVKKEVVKDLPVVLDYNPFAGSETRNGTNYRIESSKYISVPGGIYLNQLGLHTGVYFRQVGAKGDPIESNDIESLITHGGVYVGLQRVSQAHMGVILDNKEQKVGAAFVRYYADFIFLPISEVADASIEPSLKKNRSYGWRAGLQWYLDPHDGEYKRLGKSVLTAEIGSKPLTGFFINMSWGFAILNFE